VKIVVYAICKNEAAHVARFCDAAKDADGIVVCDTGSTDETVPLLKDHGATVHSISISPWRFDDARNAALSLVPADTDICVSLDLDEILQPGWREEVEKAWTAGTTRLRYLFDWGHGITFYSEKIHARSGYRWHHPCHERIVPDRLTEVWQDIHKLLVVHKPDETKSRGQYLDLLRISIEEDPHCDRNAFYYARELFFTGNWAEAIKQGLRHLALPNATWAEERAYCMRIIGQSHAALNQRAEALNWLRKGCAEFESRESWYAMAFEAYSQQRWAECYGAAKTCLSIQNRRYVYMAEKAVWGSAPYDLAAIAAWNLGLIEESIRNAELAVSLSPDDLRLRQNLELVKNTKKVA
jgi:glycosyltransferase involved in cell wall biosynthesis